jgi:hypothetical protein
MKTFSRLWKYLAKFFSEWEMFYTKPEVQIKTRFVFNIFSPENRAIYEIMSKNLVQPGRPQMTQYGAYDLHAG